MKLKNNYYVFTGGPGAGKTSVLDALKKRGCETVKEVGRKIIIQQNNINGNSTHSGNQLTFRKLMLEASLNNYDQLKDQNNIIFFDRGIVDIVGYSYLIKEPISSQINHIATHYRYNKKVFYPPLGRYLST